MYVKCKKKMSALHSKKFYSQTATWRRQRNSNMYTFAVATHTAAGGAVNISFVGLGHHSYNANEHMETFEFLFFIVRRGFRCFPVASD